MEPVVNEGDKFLSEIIGNDYQKMKDLYGTLVNETKVLVDSIVDNLDEVYDHLSTAVDGYKDKFEKIAEKFAPDGQCADTQRAGFLEEFEEMGDVPNPFDYTEQEIDSPYGRTAESRRWLENFLGPFTDRARGRCNWANDAPAIWSQLTIGLAEFSMNIAPPPPCQPDAPFMNPVENAVAAEPAANAAPQPQPQPVGNAVHAEALWKRRR